jgi:hypothetical protein
MLSRVFILSVSSCLVSVAHADGACDRTQQQYRDCVQLLNSLHLEKPGQMRVLAADGSEFNGGQVQWMKGQMHRFERLCALGGAENEAQAAKVLADVEGLIESHRRRS